jgi:hypothetical protein
LAELDLDVCFAGAILPLTPHYLPNVFQLAHPHHYHLAEVLLGLE